MTRGLEPPPASNPPPVLRRPLFLWGPVIVQMALIFAASSIPDLGPLPGPSDKSWHSVGYALLAGLLLRAFAGGRLAGVTWGRAIAAILLSTIYGATDEFHQTFVPGRSGDRFDLLADAVGASLAAAAGCAAAAASAWGILKFPSGPDGRHE